MKLKTMIMTAALAVNPIMNGLKAQNANFNLERIQSNEDWSRVRGNIFYNLPENTKAYTFVEQYDNKSSFMKTFVTKEIGSVNAQLEVALKSWTNNHYALGISKNNKIQDHSIGLKFLPVRYEDGFKQQSTVGFSANIKLGKNTKIESFAEYDLGKNFNFDPQMAYGEFYVKQSFKDLDLGVGFSLPSNQTKKELPDPVFGVKLRYNTKVK